MYLELCAWNKPRFYAKACCNCSAVTVCAKCNVISPVQSVLYLYISTSRGLCALHNMAVFLQFLNFALSRYVAQVLCLLLCNVPVVPIITDITCAVTCHMCWIFIMKSLCLNTISASIMIAFLSQGIASLLTCISILYSHAIIIIIIYSSRYNALYYLPINTGFVIW